MEITYNRINIFPRLPSFTDFRDNFNGASVPDRIQTTQAVKMAFHCWSDPPGCGICDSYPGTDGRWYISGHAPMSNGYESMIFVSWVTLLAGLIFMKRSGYAMALTAILAALSLLVAGMSNMNPEITNLVPVLKSPWLTIHVAVIMAGYGFLGLASIMGLMNVVFYAVLTPPIRSG